MIIWLNGPFGVGKTTTADELVQVMHQARVYDPERLGWWLRRTMGLFKPGDYQELGPWVQGVVRGAARATRHGSVVVPMSVLSLDRLDRMLAALRSRGVEVAHVLLDVPIEVLRQRITHDTITPAAKDWRTSHVDAYYAVREQLAARGAVVQTEGRGVREVAWAVSRTLRPGAGTG